MPVSVIANEINYSSSDFSNFSVENIHQYFLQNPQEKNVILAPEIKGKSRYSFSIPRDAFYISKKHSDVSDLFYLSEQIDNGLKFKPNNFKNIDIVISENYSNLILSQSILSNINAGISLENKEKISFGLSLNKDVIISKNALGNFSVEQAKDEHTRLAAKFVRLSDNENSEFFGHLDHEFKSDILNIGIGYTWFEIANQFDFTLDIQEQDKKIESEIYATFGGENIKFQIGFDQIKYNSDMNMFFNLKFENILNKEIFLTNVIISSKDSVIGIRNQSLKSFRRKTLDKLWKKYMNNN